MTINLVRGRGVYTDLINNFQAFHKKNSEEDLLPSRNRWSDDTDYKNYRTIEDLFENITDADYETSHVVTVDIKDIFSSEESKGGCDRPLWSITSNSAITKQRENLDRHKKYCQGSAQIISAMLRPDPENPGSWQIVKFIGNNRVSMKLLANNGDSTRILINVLFHERGLKQKEYIAIESELHATDAGDRSGQNELQKFISGYRANRVESVYTYDLLREHEYNYGTIMQQEGVGGSSDWLTLGSLQGIKTGEGNGYFKKYKEWNVKRALDTMKELCDITGEKVVGGSTLECFAMMYYVYTTFGKHEGSKEKMFSPKQLNDFFVYHFKENNQSGGRYGGKKLLVKDLSQTGAVKDIAWICARQFWPNIQREWMIVKEKTNAFSIGCFANTKLLGFCSDDRLKKEVQSLLT